MPVSYLALGSNLGDRHANLHAALTALRTVLTVEATSFLYASPPAYVLEQPPFLNAVCRITTTLTPFDLLASLKQIEQEMGRVASVRYGPRLIDLDILFYITDSGHQLVLTSTDLTVPHPRLAERGFVLQPLADLTPELIHPRLGQTVTALLKALDEPPLPRVLPVRSALWRHQGPTRVMGILNVTPDSFSGDGLLGHTISPVDRALRQAEQMIAAGAACLDVGGQSTRPGHELVSEAEEMDRVVPVIEALAHAVDVPISVDTFRYDVARAACAHGAHMINDVWGLHYDSRLADLAGAQGLPLVVMDNRQAQIDPVYRARVGLHPPLPDHPAPDQPAPDDPVDAVGQALARQLAVAQQRGVPRWLLVADPGMGFGKSVAAHMLLTRRLQELTAPGYPLLYGPSRKGFIGKLLGGSPPEERDMATAALCALAAERGALLVRVHNVQAAVHAVAMSDAVMGRAALPAT